MPAHRPSAATLLLLITVQLPAADGGDDALIELGSRLFFDPLLSRDRTIACGSCHVPERGFADSQPFSAGVSGRRTARNTPTLLNRARGTSFMWDGRASTLEEQALLPIENPLEMDLPLDEALARLASDGPYRAAFERVFARAPDRAGLAAALAGYVRTLVTGTSAVDRFRAGEFEALSDGERAGLWLFESRAGCWRCHSGANFSDEDFHATGVGAVDGRPEDGRFAVTGREQDRGRFKTPTLRGLALTAPYMHDGSLATLAEVVEFYRRGGQPSTHRDPLLRPIEMDERDARHLVLFLEALSRDTGPAGR
jgi:cytochrome c peroxidase